MRKARRQSLSQKLFGLTSGFLVAIAAVILAFVTGFYTAHIRDYAEHNVYLQHEKLDASVALDFYDINYTLLDLFAPEEVAAIFASEPERQSELLARVLETAALPARIDGLALELDGAIAASPRLASFAFPAAPSEAPLSLAGFDGDSLILAKYRVTVEGLSKLRIYVSVPISYYDSFFSAISPDSATVFCRPAPAAHRYRIAGDRLIVTSRLGQVAEQYDIELGVESRIETAYFSSLLRVALALVLGVTLLMSLLSLILCYRLAARLTRPLKELSVRVTNFNRFEEEGPMKKQTKAAKDEIYQLEESFDAMVQRITDLIDKNTAEAEQRRKLELESLQMQINPHFLYNTLDAIAWMAKIKKEPEIEQLVLSLAQFFRISLHRGDKIITLREEIELTKHYLEIEQIRFPKRFAVDFQLDESLLDYSTLKLILQPVVENAIKHGLPPGVENARIRISLAARGTDIAIAIEDNGQGFEVPTDILQRQRFEPLEKGGYGLFNVNERIRLEYGERYGLTVSSRPKKGTRIEILLPRVSGSSSAG